MTAPPRTKHGPAPAAICGLLSILSLAACQTVPADDAARREARAAPNAPPQQVVPAIYQTLDTDRNGRTDSMVVFAYLFPASDASALPVWAEGEFRFSLVGQDARPIAQWVFPAEQVRAHRDSDTFGPTHSFTLDIKAAAGRDDFPIQNAALSASFVRTDGVTISSAGTVGVRLGG
jgi:hypothetical protein